jgi:hypothetical protein
MPLASSERFTGHGVWRAPQFVAPEAKSRPASRGIFHGYGVEVLLACTLSTRVGKLPTQALVKSTFPPRLGTSLRPVEGGRFLLLVALKP